MSAQHEDWIPVPGQSDENPAGIYKALGDALRELHHASGQAMLQAAEVVKVIDPTYNRWHELYGEAGEPPNPPPELRLAYEQFKRLHKIRKATNREQTELDGRLYGQAITPPELLNQRPVSVRIRRIDTDITGKPGPWWEATWQYDNGSGSGILSKDQGDVLACVTDEPAPDMQIQDPETGEWSPWTPEADS